MAGTDELIADLRETIEAASDSGQPEPERRFHKHDEYLSYGLKTADFREILKKFRPRFRKLSLTECLTMASQLLAEHIGELGHAGIYLVSLKVQELRPKHFNLLDDLVEDFRSWSQVDNFCGQVMKPLLWKYPQEALALLEDWTSSPSRWKRRASVVTFTRQVGESGEFTQKVLDLCENLIWDGEDIVRKGVGLGVKRQYALGAGADNPLRQGPKEKRGIFNYHSICDSGPKG